MPLVHGPDGYSNGKGIIGDYKEGWGEQGLVG